MTAAAPLHFTQVNGRRVSWRCLGAGPAALLLHGSPQSSRALQGLGHAVAAAGMCAVMPDTPGAGHAEPLPDENLTIAGLATALAAFADATGLGRFALYGSHTGAAIAASFAAAFPQRVTTLVLDGIAAWTAAERAAFQADYAPPFHPTADGTHLTWLWSRMEAQSVFFPWPSRTAAAWRGVDLSPPWHLHRNAMDMLDAGDAYRAIYLASLVFDPAAVLPFVQAPVQLMMARADVLAPHAARPELQHLPTFFFNTPEALHTAVAARLAAAPGDALAAPPAAGLFWRGTLAGRGRPLVLLHPAGASSRFFATALPDLMQHRPTIAFDLPGHGFSGGTLPATAASVAALVTAECRRHGLQTYDIAGRRFGGVVAQAMARHDARTVDIGARAAAPDLAARGAVSLAPEWDGAHLLRAWRTAFRQAIWDPWYNAVNAAVRQPPGDLSPAALHAAAVDLLRAGPAWATANAIEAAAGPAAHVLHGADWVSRLAAW